MTEKDLEEEIKILRKSVVEFYGDGCKEFIIKFGVYVDETSIIHAQKGERNLKREVIK